MVRVTYVSRPFGLILVVRTRSALLSETTSQLKVGGAGRSLPFLRSLLFAV